MKAHPKGVARSRAGVLSMDGLSTSVLGAIGMVVLSANAVLDADEDARGHAPYSLSDKFLCKKPFAPSN